MSRLRAWLNPILARPQPPAIRGTRTSHERVPTTGMTFELTRKPIKRIYLRIKPPEGRIAVSAPASVPLSHIHTLLNERQDWIHQQQTRIIQSQPATPPAPLGAGHLIHCLGQPLTLQIHPAARAQRTEITADILQIHLRQPAPTAQHIQDGVNRHLRTVLQHTLAERTPIWVERIGVAPSFIGIKRMKTRWGSCNIRDRRIWLNLELARMPIECIDLVLVHELVHLHERHHNARFYAFMDHHLPNWRHWQAELSRYGMAGL